MGNVFKAFSNTMPAVLQLTLVGETTSHVLARDAETVNGFTPTATSVALLWQ